MNKKVISLFLFSISIMLIFISPAYAAKKNKKITTVSLKVDNHVELDTKVGEEYMDVSISSDKYYFDNAEALNETFRWTADETPRYKLTIQASEGYEFAIKRSSDFIINGATYVSSTTENSRTTLILTIKLPALKYQLSPITSMNINEDGVLTWNQSTGAGSYEIKFYRGDSLISGILTTTDNTMNLREFMQKQGTYHFMVRAINKSDSNIAGNWYESNNINIDYTKAEENKYWVENINIGTWGQNSTGQWYYKLPNGKYAKNEWKKIKGEWYYFNDNSIMVTGWLENSGKWYYFDKTNGNMLKNTVTPDGYFVAIDGSWSNSK